MAAPRIQQFTRPSGPVKEAVFVTDSYFTTRYAVEHTGAIHADALTRRPGANVEDLLDDDPEHSQAGEKGFFLVNSLDLEPLVSGKEDIPGEVRDFFRRHVPEDLAAAARVPSGELFNTALNYHLQGDREARLQIVQAFPSFRRDLYTAEKGSKVLALIDARKSPASEFRRLHGLDEIGFRTVRRIQAIQSRAIADGVDGAWNIIAHGTIRDIPKIVTPNHAVADVKDVASIAAALRSFSMLNYGPVPQALKIRTFRGAAISKWPSVLKEIDGVPRSAYDFSSMMGVALESAITTGIARKIAPEALASCAEVIPRFVKGEDIADTSDASVQAVEGYCDALRTAGIARSSLRSTCTSIVAEHVSLKRFREYAERWHHRQSAMREKAMTVPSEVNWEPMVGQVSLGSLSARELRSNRDLEAQGRVQNNCVGGYTDVLIKSTDDKVELIFSIEDDQEVHSTIRVVGDRRHRRTGYDLRVGEHSAHSNKAPSPLARRAAEDLLEHLQTVSPDVVSDYGRRMTRTEGLPTMISRVMEDSRANVFDASAPETLLDAYESVTPRQLRAWTVDDWTAAARAAGMQAEIKALERSFARLEEKTLHLKEKEADHECQP